MRLLIVSQDYPPEIGGIQKYTYELSLRFEKLFEKISLIIPANKKSRKFDKTLNFKIHRIPGKNTFLPYTISLVYSKIAQKGEYDISFHSQWQTVASAIRSRKKGYPKKIYVAAHARELLFNPFEHGILEKRYQKYQLKLLHKVDHFFPVSDYTAGLLESKGIKRDKITVVRSGTDPYHFFPKDVTLLKQKLGLLNKKVLLTTTRLVKRKGVDSVIQALKQVVIRHPDVIYLIVGDGPEKENLRKLVSNSDLENYVTFYGEVSSNLNDYYNLCDVFVMTSKKLGPDVEGFGLVFLEAGACEKPVIGTHSGGIPDAISDGETGFLVKEGDINELAGAINKLLDDSELRTRLGKQGRKRILEEFNWDTTANTIFEKISELNKC